MSAIDRLANLARGVVADGQKRFDAGGGLEGATQRVSDRARELAESARQVVEGGLPGGPDAESGTAAPSEWSRARAEVDGLASAPSTRPTASSTPARASSATASDATLSAGLAELDEKLRAGSIDRPTWEADRAALLDAHDRTSRPRTPRPRTL